MSVLSVVLDDDAIPRCAANPIHVISWVGDTLTFEVLEVNAPRLLKELVGRKEVYGYEGRAFLGELVSLDSCESTAYDLSLMRDRAALRGVLKIMQWTNGMTDNKLAKQEVHQGLGITENVDQLLHDLLSIADDHLADVNQDLSPTFEQKAGEGRLISESGHCTEVVFVLRVWIGITGKSARSSPPKVERQSRIWIKALGGKQISDGEYELHTVDEILKVTKQNNAWKVVE
jgi:hypothetical protein